MSADADRIYIEQIDLLNTTLVETRRERDEAEEKLAAERAAAQSELAEWKLRAVVAEEQWNRVLDVEAERDAARAELAERFRDEMEYAATTKPIDAAKAVIARLRLDVSAVEKERDAAIAREQAAQSEAAAMRDHLQKVAAILDHHDHDYRSVLHRESCSLCRAIYSLPGLPDAGRALAARVSLLESKVRAVGELLAENGCDCECDHHPDEHDAKCERCLACRISAALDEKSE